MVLSAPKLLAIITAAAMVLAGTLILTTDQVRDPTSSDVPVTYSGGRILLFRTYDEYSSNENAHDVLFP